MRLFVLLVKGCPRRDSIFSAFFCVVNMRMSRRWFKIELVVVSLLQMLRLLVESPLQVHRVPYGVLLPSLVLRAARLARLDI